MSVPLPVDIARVDPAVAWEPWKPDARDPWNARWAGHLLRRAAFGASPERLGRAVREGPEKTIDELLTGSPDCAETDAILARAGEQFVSLESIDMIRGWWVYAMLYGGHPLREKMTLFWHDHFATSVVKVKSPALMYRQNQLLRKHALGKFGLFLRQVGRDVAMLLWLDSNQNVKGRPNENYARELMELFSLGVGNYTEKDVQEAARAFTGWHTDDEQTAFAFSNDDHDDGVKTVLGKSGKWTGDDLIPILLERPACGLFIAGKIYREFISETAPPRRLLEPLARRFHTSGGDIADLVGTMLRSRLFFSSHAFQRRIKSPVEFVLGAVQAAWPGPFGTPGLAVAISRMGQKLFAPPNVKGWPGGRSWLNTSTLLARNNFAEEVAMGRGASINQPVESTDLEVAVPAPPVTAIEEKKGTPPKYVPTDPPPSFDLAARLGKTDPTKPDAAVHQLLEMFLPGYAADNTRKQIANYVVEGRPTGAHLRDRLREAAHAVLCSSDYQLC
jgi:uncharacterized protein (DUF1800 family)